jgi:hypothetical protein
MFFKEGTDRNGSTLVREPASAAGRRRSFVKTAGSKFDNGLTWLRSKPSNQFMMSSTLAPASKFSNMTETGMRVPRSTQAPLTFPGMLSTAGHCDQSSAPVPLVYPKSRGPVCSIFECQQSSASIEAASETIVSGRCHRLCKGWRQRLQSCVLGAAFVKHACSERPYEGSARSFGKIPF